MLILDSLLSFLNEVTDPERSLLEVLGRGVSTPREWKVRTGAAKEADNKDFVNGAVSRAVELSHFKEWAQGEFKSQNIVC